MSTLDAGLVVLNWNGLSDTLSCLDSIYRSESIPGRVVIVDNGSSDQSVQGILQWISERPRFEVSPVSRPYGTRLHRWVVQDEDAAASGVSRIPADLTLIETGSNLGFAGGNNVGIRYLLEGECRCVMLLNNDAVLADGALLALVESLDRSEGVQAVVPQIRYLSQPQRVWNCGGYWTWLGRPRYAYGDADAAEVPSGACFPVTFVTGCALMIRASWLRANGLLTERFFFGEEDAELSWRLRSQGRDAMLCCPRAIVFHKVSASSKRLPAEAVGRVYVHYLNRLVFLRSIWGAGVRWQYRRALTAAYWAWYLVTRFRYPLRPALAEARDLAREAAEGEGVDADRFHRLLRAKSRPRGHRR